MYKTIMLYSLLFFFNSLSISSCCSAVACIVSSSVTLGIFRSTGNESTKSRVSLGICGFTSSILLLSSGNNNYYSHSNEKSTQAYKLYSKGNKPVEVAIEKSFWKASNKISEILPLCGFDTSYIWTRDTLFVTCYKSIS